MSPTEKAYIDGIDFTITTIKGKLTEILQNPQSSPSLIGTKMDFLEPVRDALLNSSSEKTLELQTKLDKHLALCVNILQTTKAKRVRRKIFETLGKEL